MSIFVSLFVWLTVLICSNSCHVIIYISYCGIQTEAGQPVGLQLVSLILKLWHEIEVDRYHICVRSRLCVSSVSPRWQTEKKCHVIIYISYCGIQTEAGQPVGLQLVSLILKLWHEIEVDRYHICVRSRLCVSSVSPRWQTEKASMI